MLLPALLCEANGLVAYKSESIGGAVFRSDGFMLVCRLCFVSFLWFK